MEPRFPVRSESDWLPGFDDPLFPQYRHCWYILSRVSEVHVLCCNFYYNQWLSCQLLVWSTTRSDRRVWDKQVYTHWHMILLDKTKNTNLHNVKNTQTCDYSPLIIWDSFRLIHTNLIIRNVWFLLKMSSILINTRKLFCVKGEIGYLWNWTTAKDLCGPPKGSADDLCVQTPYQERLPLSSTFVYQKYLHL